MPFCPSCKKAVSEGNLQVCPRCGTVNCWFCSPQGLCPKCNLLGMKKKEEQ